MYGGYVNNLRNEGDLWYFAQKIKSWFEIH